MKTEVTESVEPPCASGSSVGRPVGDGVSETSDRRGLAIAISGRDSKLMEAHQSRHKAMREEMQNEIQCEEATEFDS